MMLLFSNFALRSCSTIALPQDMKNRINKPMLLQHGQELILIGELGYSIVQFNHFKAPRHPAVLDFQMREDHLGQDRFTVMFEFIVKSVERTFHSR